MILQEYLIAGEKIILGNLEKKQIKKLLLLEGTHADSLHRIAKEITCKLYNRKCFLRGVIEISNICQNDCKYCAMHRSNQRLERYILSKEELSILIRNAGLREIRTIMLQGGESTSSYELIAASLSITDVSNLNIMVCIGNLDNNKIQNLRALGVKAYSIKFETSNSDLFLSLRGNKLDNRVQCLINARQLHMPTSSGIILGLPNQSISDLVNDLSYLQYLKLPMNSISPFIPAHETELVTFSKPKIDIVLNFISLLRLVNPTSLIPAVSALNLLVKDGQNRALNAGANVLTINLTPCKNRDKYLIYDSKRFIVELDYVKNLINKNIFTMETNNSLGPKYLDVVQEGQWFDFRYTNDNYSISVYGEPSSFFEKTISPLLEKKFTVIDIGGGDGRHSIPIAKRVKQVISVDNNIYASNRLRKRIFVSQLKQNIRSIYNDIFKYSSNLKYDLVICSNVLYYYDKEKMVRLLELCFDLANPKKFVYLCFESSIIMSMNSIEFFSVSNIYNYTKENIDEVILNRNDIELISYEYSFHAKKFSIKSDSQIQNAEYSRTFVLHEFLIKRT